jgi:hypothetical protein
MKCRFLSLEESGNGTDFIMAIECQPNVLERLAGDHPEVREFFGPRPAWITMDGMAAPRKIQQVLDKFWQEHLPQTADWRGTAPWKVVEPAADG